MTVIILHRIGGIPMDVVHPCGCGDGGEREGLNRDQKEQKGEQAAGRGRTTRTPPDAAAVAAVSQPAGRIPSPNIFFFVD